MRHRAPLLAAVLLVSSTLPGFPAGTVAPPAAPASPAPDAGLTAGINLVRDGDFDGAILILDAAARRLQSDGARQKEAARAYAYLGVAYLELDQEVAARGKFEAAQALDPQLRLDPREFSSQQIRVFDSVRPAGTAAAPAPLPSPSPSPGDKTAAAAVPPKKKKKSVLPWVLFAGVVGGGAAVASGGGEGGGADPTTTTLGGVGNTTSTTPGTTTTTTAPPGSEPGNPTTTTTTSTTPPGTPTTTTLTPTTTTTTSTTTPTTSTTTTTTMPSCSYVLSPGTQQVPRLGGSGTCQVDTSRQGCPWRFESSDNSWLHVSNPAAGSGDGAVGFTAELNGFDGARSARIRLQSDPGNSCTVNQPGLLGMAGGTAGTATLSSTLDLEGGEGQIVVDGSTALFQRRGGREAVLAEGRALHRIEATVVNAEGRAGTWRFQVEGGVAPGTLRVVAGNGALAGDAAVVFRLSGKPGERVVFAFRN